MSQILTFLGQGGPQTSILAVAAAKSAAQQGRRTLLVGHQVGHDLGELLNVSLSTDPTTVAANLSAVQLKNTVLLEKSWSQAREVEAQYVRSPFFQDIYAQELAILPGMDQFLTLDALRRFDDAKQYDSIIYDGSADLTVLRMFGIPEVASWYWRRATKAFLDSELAKNLRPFAEPIIRSVTNLDVTSLDELPEQFGDSRNLLQEGVTAVSDPARVLAHLVTSKDPMAIRTAKYLWGSAQMIGLTVGSVLVTPAGEGSIPEPEFAPLPLREVPAWDGGNWAPLEEAVGGVFGIPNVPAPLTIDAQKQVVKLFIPGFSKSQVELSQSGPEITITAGDQRRNLFLPDSLAGREVSGAKFQDQFLIISFA